MKKLLSLFFSIALSLAGLSLWAQKPNIAPQATVTVNSNTAGGTFGCGGGPCPGLNDLNFGTCGNQQVWISTSTPPSSNIGDDWIEWNWPNPESMDEMTIHHGQTDRRFLDGFVIQYWDGSGWVSADTISGLPVQCVNNFTFNRIVASRMRITRFEMAPLIQVSNPNFREIEIFQASTSDDDAGVVGTNTVPAVCPGSFPVEVTIQNFGLNQIDSVEVHWEMDGVAQPTVHYTNTLDTMGGTGSSSALVNLGNWSFASGVTYNLKAWTALPNGNADTVNFNDTLTATIGLGAPTGLAATNITSNSADLTWTGITGTTYGVVFGPAGFNQATGGTTILPATSPQSISGLNPSSAYDFYVFADCGGGVFSTLAGPVTFNTLISSPRGVNCTSANPAVVFSDGFENQGVWSGDIGTSNAQWQYNSGTTGSGNTGPSGAYKGNQYIYFEASSTGSASLVSPAIDLTQAQDSAELSFWMHAYGDDIGPLVVRVSTNSATSGFNDTIFLYNQGELQTSSSDPWQQVGVRLDQYVGQQIWIEFFYSTSATFHGDLALDDVAVVTCGNFCLPELFSLDSIGTTGTTATIVPDTSSATFQYEWGPCGFSQGTGIVQSGTAPLTITGLVPNSCYDLYIRRDCSGSGAGFSSWQKHTFNTALAGPRGVNCTSGSPVPIFSDGFETQGIWSGDIGTGNAVWRYNSGTTTSSSTGPSGAHSGSQYIYFEASSTGNASLVSPLIDLSQAQDSAELSFWMHAYGDDIGPLAVGVSTNSATGPFNDTVFFYDQGELQTSESDPWQQIGARLDQYVGQQIWIEFFYSTSATFHGDLALDDVAVFTCGNFCLPEVTTLQSVNVNATSATIIPDTTNDTFQYEWGPCGFGQGTGTTGSGTPPLQLTGLAPNTCYDLYIRRDCSGSGAGFSSWQLHSFTTPCQETAPYFEDFESSTVGHWDGLDNCWMYESNNPGTTNSGGYSWEARNTAQTTSGTSTGPDRDATLFPNQGGVFITADVSGSSTAGPDSSLLTSPTIDISSLTSPELEYHVHRLGTVMADLFVDIYDGSAWVRGVHSYTNTTGMQSSPSDDWKDTIIDLSPYLGTPNFRVRFRTVTNGCCAGDNAIDQIRISDPIPCPNPSGFGLQTTTTTSATVNWDSSGYAGATFDLEYGAFGFTLGNGTRVNVNGDSYTISGLTTTNLCQDVYLRANCGNDSSMWIGPISACPEAVLCDSMDQYSTGLIAPQSALIYGWYGGNGGAVSVSTAQAASGTQSMYIPADGTSDVVAWFDTIDNGAWNFSIDVYVPSGTDAYYNFQRHYTHGNTSQTNVWAFDVFLNANGSATVDGGSYGGTGVANFSYNNGQWNTIEHIIDFDNDTVWIEVNGSATSAGWQYSFNNFSAPVQCNGINFYSNPNISTPDYYVDNICIDPYIPPPCPVADTLETFNIGCDSVEVRWRNGNNPAILEYGPTGFTPGTGTVDSNASSPYRITGLTPGNSYDFYVTTFCGNDTAAMAGPETFTTSTGPLSAVFNFVLGQATASDRPVIFDASLSQGAHSYSWDFGDSNTGNGINPTHNYTANGSYVVTLTIAGPCGTDSIQDTVDVTEISVQDLIMAQSLRVYPNPSFSELNISVDVVGSDLELQLNELSGKRLYYYRSHQVNGTFETRLDMNDFAPGTYLLRITSEEGSVQRKVIKR